MDKEKKSIFKAPLNMDGTTRVTLLVVVGGYLIYMAYQMVRDTLSGVSSMGLTTTLILAGLMALAGIAVIGYGVCLWSFSRKKKDEQKSEETDEE